MIDSTDQNDTERTEEDDDDGKIGAKDKSSEGYGKVTGRQGGKKISCKEKKWSCDDKPLWRVFVNSYIDKEVRLEKEDRFDRREAPLLPRFPKVKSSEQIPTSAAYPCLPLNTFNLRDRARLPDRLKPHEKIRLWRSMKNYQAVDTGSFLPEVRPEIARTNSDKWPGVWPCVNRDLAGELKKIEKLRKRKRKGLLPCQSDSDSESNLEVPRDDFADRKELGHARVPIACPSVKKSQLVDRASGEHPGLVDGDYVVFVFDSGDDGKENRSYADVCLRGLKGMHLAELSCKRVREKTWKFCFYQAIVALLAKTQLRYKYAWSVNIDYIFDHAWMLFVHMGGINVKERIRLDDVVVYNYKYSVELELVHEMKDAPRITTVGWNFVEENLASMMELERPELTKIKEQIGSEKPTYPEPPPVHESTRTIEEWFDKLPDIYRNCVLRTSKFSLAFWKDGTFWYLFNPYRCDEFGFWRDDGYACIMKFCTRISLKRHLMILMLRAYSYEPQSPLKIERKNDPNAKTDEPRAGIDSTIDEDDKSLDEPTIREPSSIADETGKNVKPEFFTIQIYQMIYHCVKIHNVKLLQRKPPDPRTERVRKKTVDHCDSYPPAPYDPCTEENFSMELENEYENDTDDTTEKPSWLERLKLKWTRFAAPAKRSLKEEPDGKLRWHQFYVEEPNKIFSLWGEIHPTEEMFAKANRGKQMYACYVVCAGMTRIQAPEYWSPKTLDAIVMCGDRYYTLSRLESVTAGRCDESRDPDGSDGHLGKHCKIGETLFEVEILPAVCGRLYDRSGRCLWRAVEETFVDHHFGILTCECHCLCIFKFCGSYYMMDANSVGPPLFQYGAGVAYLIRATSFARFMNVLVLTIGSSECSRFFLNPIEIGRVVDLGTTTLREKRGKSSFRKLECPHDDRTKGSKRLKDEGKRTIDRVSCRRNGGNGCGN